MKNLILLLLVLSLMFVIGCNNDPIVLPCEIADEHFNNGGTVLAILDNFSFMGQSVFQKNEDGSINFYISRFSSDQCFTRDLITIPPFNISINDSIYFNTDFGIEYEIRNERASILVNKKLAEGKNWFYPKEINLDTTEIRGDFQLSFIDEDSDPLNPTGLLIFENGQFFSEWRE